MRSGARRRIARTLADRQRQMHRRAFVAQTSKSAVSRVSKPAGRTKSSTSPIWKSAIQQVWKPALRLGGDRIFATRLKTSTLALVSAFGLMLARAQDVPAP